MEKDEKQYYKVNKDGSLTKITFKEYAMIYCILSNYFTIQRYVAKTEDGEVWQEHVYLQVEGIVNIEGFKEEYPTEVFVLMEDYTVKEKTNE